MQEMQEYKLKLARDAIKAKEDGVTYAHFSTNKGVPYSTLMDWIRYAKANPEQEQESNP